MVVQNLVQRTALLAGFRIKESRSVVIKREVGAPCHNLILGRQT